MHLATYRGSGLPGKRLPSLDASRSLCYEMSVMLSRIGITLVVAITLPAAATPLSARTCILSNVASEKACKLRCCANMTCCITSSKNTAPSSQPLSKHGSSQETNAISAPTVVAVLPHQSGDDWPRHQVDIASAALSPPRLPLLCTFLI